MKILEVLNILKTYTDETHPLTATQIVDELAKRNIKAERKSIYAYINQLKDAGYEIYSDSRMKGWYYVPEFDLYEYKIIMDAINGSDFISEKRSDELCDKLTENVYVKKELEKTKVYSPYKTKDNSIVYNIDILVKAIKENKAIKFNYTDTYYSGKKRRKHNYERVPKALVFFNQRYYCIMYSDHFKNYGHFRVDKFEKIEMYDHDLLVPELDVKKYIADKFNMNTGKKENVTIEFDNNVEYMVYDKFKESVILMQQNDEKFVVNMDAVISKDYLGWIMSFGTQAKVLKPQSLIDEIKKMNREILNQYE